MTILTSVTELEDRVVETVKSLQQPVVEYVRKGVERAEGRIPRLSYPESLPKPSEVIESQYNFARALLDTQREFVSELVEAVAPLVRPEPDEAAEAPVTPAPKTSAKPAAKASRKSGSTKA